jgi:hypothetical protein
VPLVLDFSHELPRSNFTASTVLVIQVIHRLPERPVRKGIARVGAGVRCHVLLSAARAGPHGFSPLCPSYGPRAPGSCRTSSCSGGWLLRYAITHAVGTTRLRTPPQPDHPTAFALLWNEAWQGHPR